MLDSYHYYEIGDRLYCIDSIINEVILRHPVLQKHKKLRQQVEKAQTELIIAYQMTAGLEVSVIEKEDSKELENK